MEKDAEKDAEGCEWRRMRLERDSNGEKLEIVSERLSMPSSHAKRIPARAKVEEVARIGTESKVTKSRKVEKSNTSHRQSQRPAFISISQQVVERSSLKCL